MLTVEQQNRVTMAALYGDAPAAYGLPDTEEVRAAIRGTKAWLDAHPDAVIDMVSEWPESDKDYDISALYNDPAGGKSKKA